ncbi:MAG: putative motility protein [Lawsonibacter sp.]|nr:putative motility protein [Lawsonibacter sp.]
MMESIASMAMSMNAAQFANQYAISVTKKMMDTQELAGQELLRMLPTDPSLGQHIDTYA